MHQSLVFGLVISIAQCTIVSINLGSGTMTCNTETGSVDYNGPDGISESRTPNGESCVLYKKKIYLNCKFLRDLTPEDEKKIQNYDADVKKWDQALQNHEREQEKERQQQIQDKINKINKENEQRDKYQPWNNPWNRYNPWKSQTHQPENSGSSESDEGSSSNENPGDQGMPWAPNNPEHKEFPWNKKGHKNFPWNFPFGPDAGGDFAARVKRAFVEPFPEYPNLCATN